MAKNKNKNKPEKEIRFIPDKINFEQRKEGDSDSEKLIVEGYPIVFDKETFIGEKPYWGWYEIIDRKAFENADMSDVILRYNHNDNFEPLARTRNDSLTLTVDDKGVFMHAELIDTTTNRDMYKMVKSKLITEGSFAFSVSDEVEEGLKDEYPIRRITGIAKLFDVSICDRGAYGDLTEVYARSRELVETKHAELESSKQAKRNILKLRNKNKLLLIGGTKKWN